MKVGLQLPQFTFDGSELELERVLTIIDDIVRVGFRLIATNDNLVFPSEEQGPQRPWLDGPTLLSLAVGRAGHEAQLEAVSLTLALHRGVAMCARTLATINHLVQGRFTAVLAPGSSTLGHRLAGVEPSALWSEFQEATVLIRALLGHQEVIDTGPVASAAGSGLKGPSSTLVSVGRLRSAELESPPPPVWLASWGSPAGLRRVAHHADGWLASAYALDTDQFAVRLRELRQVAAQAGRDPGSVRSGLATAFIFVAESEREAARVLEQRLAPRLGKDPRALRGRVFIGTSEHVNERVELLALAGADLLLLVPIETSSEQIESISDAVLTAH